MDVHSACKATWEGGEYRFTNIHMEGRMYGMSICDEMRGLRPPWGRCPNGKKRKKRENEVKSKRKSEQNRAKQSREVNSMVLPHLQYCLMM
jgi:hypothetical protein